EMTSRSRMGAINSIVSIATVATAPCASRPATMPPAMSIWLSTQPPKICPLALMSAGRGTTRNIGSRGQSAAAGLSVMVHIRVVFERVLNRLVMAAAARQEDKAHQRGAQQDRQAHPGSGSDDHVDGEFIAHRETEPAERADDGQQRYQRHAAHQPAIAGPGDLRRVAIVEGGMFDHGGLHGPGGRQ